MYLLSKIERAQLVAFKAHANATYDIYRAYTYHVEMVARIAKSLGYDEAVIVSCYLHDVLEDTGLSYNDIKKAFGAEIAEIVYAVTDESGRNRNERKEKTYPKIIALEKAVIVKVCDRIANMVHSKEYNPKLFEMYCNELEGFKKALKHPQHYEANRAWEELENISLK